MKQKKKKLKILLIHNFYTYWGGEDTYVTSLKKLLEKHGHKVIFYFKNSNEIKTIWDKIKIGLGLLWNYQTQKEVESIIENEKPDIAHIHNVFPIISPTVYYTLAKHKIKIIQHIHNYRFLCPKGNLFRKGKICELCIKNKFAFHALIYKCYHDSFLASFFITLSFYICKITNIHSKITLYIFPSYFTQKYYKKYLNTPKNKSTYLPYFVDIKPMQRKVKKQNYFLFVGRLSEEKGIIQLLEYFKNKLDKQLKIIGNGPLWKQIQQYKRYKNIHILGSRSYKKTIEFINKASNVVISSRWYEVLPLFLLEGKLLKSNIYCFEIIPESIKLFVENNKTIFFKNKKLIKLYIKHIPPNNILKNTIIKIYRTM